MALGLVQQQVAENSTYSVELIVAIIGFIGTVVAAAIVSFRNK